MQKQHGLLLAKRAVLFFAAIVLTLVLVTPAVMAAENHEVIVERNVAAKMRDGITLRADIYRPKADGKFPVLLVRTPYDKTGETNFGLKAAARGYVAIAQDVRGRFTSEGDWYTFKNESRDGYDTVEWAAALPYSNGKVGDVWRIVRGRDTIPGGNRETATPGGDLPQRDGVELS